MKTLELEGNENLLSDINSYLSFKLDEEVFSLNVSKVLEILEMSKITKVPKAPRFMRGVINLRGSVLPVIDTREKFGLAPKEDTINTCIIVIEITMNGDLVNLGMVVDAVQEVLEIQPSQIQPPPSIGNNFQSEFISGMAKIDENFIMFLNVDRVFSTDEITIVRTHSEEEITAEEEHVTEQQDEATQQETTVEEA